MTGAMPSLQRKTVPPAPGMGWYPTPAGVLRWWDGKQWTGFKVKNGVPKTDWVVTDQPQLMWVLGGVLILIAVVGTVNDWYSALGMMAIAVLFFGAAAQTQVVRRLPAPRSGPICLDVVRPLPGEQEGPGAGWYAVAPNTGRWWTGTRWSQYAGNSYGVRPTFHGVWAYRSSLVVAWVILGPAVLTFGTGIALLVANPNDPMNSNTILGLLLIPLGLIFTPLGAGLLLGARARRRALLLPTEPPNFGR